MSLSLYEIEEELLALLDTAEGGIDEAQREEFERTLIEAQMNAVEKRERVGKFLLSLMATEEALREEEERIKRRRRVIANTTARMEKYIIAVIRAIGPNKDGKHCKLVGTTVQFSLRRSPDSVEITSEDLIPAEFLTEKITYQARKADIKKALQDGIQVPGAFLVTDKFNLRVE